jgi:hypothetical protein
MLTSGLVGLLIFVLVLGLVIWLALYIIDMLPLPAPFNMVAKVLVLIIALIAILDRAMPFLTIR